MQLYQIRWAQQQLQQQNISTVQNGLKFPSFNLKASRQVFSVLVFFLLCLLKKNSRWGLINLMEGTLTMYSTVTISHFLLYAHHEKNPQLFFGRQELIREEEQWKLEWRVAGNVLVVTLFSVRHCQQLPTLENEVETHLFLKHFFVYCTLLYRTWIQYREV